MIIPLTQGKVALVDDEDFELLSQWKWRAKKCEHKNGVVWLVFLWTTTLIIAMAMACTIGGRTFEQQHTHKTIEMHKSLLAAVAVSRAFVGIRKFPNGQHRFMSMAVRSIWDFSWKNEMRLMPTTLRRNNRLANLLV